MDSLSARFAINVSGTMKLPVSCYDEEDPSKSMNLRFTILAGDDKADYEYTTDNNSLYRSLEPVSLFDVPDTLNLNLGNTVEIPVEINNTRLTEEPAITVQTERKNNISETSSTMRIQRNSPSRRRRKERESSELRTSGPDPSRIWHLLSIGRASIS